MRLRTGRKWQSQIKCLPPANKSATAKKSQTKWIEQDAPTTNDRNPAQPSADQAAVQPQILAVKR